jgi:hypothetical protein
MNYILLPCIAMSVWGFGAATLDGTTNVPLQWVFGCLTGVLFAGMWIASKVTKFDERLRVFAEQQQANTAQHAEATARMNRIDAHLCTTDDRINEMFERLFGHQRKNK